jgi:hypothetical protein
MEDERRTMRMTDETLRVNHSFARRYRPRNRWIDRHTVPNNATTSTQLNEQSAKLAPSWPQSLQDAF